MMVSRTGEGCKISVDGEEVEEVNKLKYLGVMISGDGRCDDEIEQRIGAAARVAGAMRKEVLERRELQKKLKCGSSMLWWCQRSYTDVRRGQCRGDM